MVSRLEALARSRADAPPALARLVLERLGLSLTIGLGYAVDFAYLVMIAWVRGRAR